MKETKQAAAAPAARRPWHEMMAAFEAFKAANDERFRELERGRTEPLLEEKVARIDATLQAAERRLERVVQEGRRPVIGEPSPSHASGAGPSLSRARERGDETKAAWDGFLRAGSTVGLEFKAGLADTVQVLQAGVGAAGGCLAPPETERLVERRPRPPPPGKV